MRPDPFYIVQSAERRTYREAQAWVRERAAEARSEGAQLIRVSWADGDLLLVEGWKEKVVPDQGSPRWALQHAILSGDR